jgi:hypothetical protein
VKEEERALTLLLAWVRSEEGKAEIQKQVEIVRREIDQLKKDREVRQAEMHIPMMAARDA